MFGGSVTLAFTDSLAGSTLAGLKQSMPASTFACIGNETSHNTNTVYTPAPSILQATTCNGFA